MPDTPKDRRLDKMGLWALQTIFAIGLLVAGWFLGGLYERMDKNDDKVNKNTTQRELNKAAVEKQAESNSAQWRKIGDLESRLSRIEGSLSNN